MEWKIILCIFLFIVSVSTLYNLQIQYEKNMEEFKDFQIKYNDDIFKLSNSIDKKVHINYEMINMLVNITTVHNRILKRYE